MLTQHERFQSGLGPIGAGINAGKSCSWLCPTSSDETGGTRRAQLLTILLVVTCWGCLRWLRRVNLAACDLRQSSLLIKSKCRRWNKNVCETWAFILAQGRGDCSQVPWPRAWKAVSRGTRGLLRTLNFSLQVFDLSKARHHIDEMVRGIQAHSDMCWKCGIPLHQVSVVVADIDQASEACMLDSSLCVVSGSGCERPRMKRPQPNMDKKVGEKSMCKPCRRRCLPSAE